MLSVYFRQFSVGTPSTIKYIKRSGLPKPDPNKKLLFTFNYIIIAWSKSDFQVLWLFSQMNIPAFYPENFLLFFLIH